MIKISVNNTNAFCTYSDSPLTSGRVGLQVKAVFSEAWQGLIKTAVIMGSGVTLDMVVDKTGVFTIPHECMTSSGSTLKVGLYGMTADGTVVIPTVYCTIGTIQEGAIPTGENGEDPTPSVFDQIVAAATEAAERAETAQGAAEAAEEAANASAEEAATSAKAAEKANASAVAQAETATAAAQSAAVSEEAAKASAGNAQASEQAAGQYSQSAGEYAAAAEASANNAKASETAAAASAAAAAESAVAAQSAADSFSIEALLGLRIVDGLLCCVCE
jgi:hypothetical protein